MKVLSLFATVLPAECEAGGGRVKLKVGNVVIGRGMFGKFTGATVSSCSRFILDLPFNLPRYFSLSVSSVLEERFKYYIFKKYIDLYLSKFTKLYLINIPQSIFRYWWWWITTSGNDFSSHKSCIL